MSTPEAPNAARGEGVTQRPPDLPWLLVFGCWAVATMSTPGALFFREVMKLPPCALCRYQRVFMFPLMSFLAFSIMNALPVAAHYRSKR